MRGYPRNRLIERSDEDRVATRSASSRGRRIIFADIGSGGAIVLIPGWTMSAADWWDAGYLDHFASSHRVLAVDPLGNGLSDKPHDPEAYRWPEVANDIVAVLDALQIDRAVMWGYSRGANIAAVVAAEFPERVSGLVLTDGGDMSTDTPAGAAVTPNAEALSRGDFEPLWTAFRFSDEDRRYDAEFNDPIALGAMSIAVARYGITYDLGRVTAPALVIVGGEDDPHESRATAAALGAEIHVLPGLDHLQEFTRTDLVFPLVDAFLRTHRL
jgi:pimeloyl-ACP methyl ester carboxylesterase